MSKTVVRSFSIISVLAILLAQFGLGSVAAAANFTVNSTADAVDANPGDGLCETRTPGECTLRAAVQETNVLPGEDTITIPAGTYYLSIAGAWEDNAATGDLDITDDLVVTGAGMGVTLIDGNELDRIFDIRSGAL
jgi:CSLREA domain-containing protein